MKNQALFSLKDKSKNLKCPLLQFLLGALRIKGSNGYFCFYCILHRNYCKQTVLILIICRVLWNLSWVCTVCIPLQNGFPGSSIPTRGEIFSNVNGVALHTAFHYHHCPDITEILLKRT